MGLVLFLVVMHRARHDPSDSAIGLPPLVYVLNPLDRLLFLLPGLWPFPLSVSDGIASV